MNELTDTELAFALVERGIGRYNPIEDSYIIANIPLMALQFVRDARVAMACMKRLDTGFNTIRYNDGRWTARTIKNSNWHGLHESLERAICMAFVEAMK